MTSQSLLVGYGYRTDELRLSNSGCLPPIPPWDASAKFFFRRHGFQPLKRQVVKTSLGVHVPGVTLPRPDLSDPDSVADGAKKRFCHQGPAPSFVALAKLYETNDEIIKERFNPLPADSDVSVPTWLDCSNYPLWRKEELLAAELRLPELLRDKKGRDKLLSVKSFIKLEDYPVFKYPRPINSRVDEYKCLVGPVLKLVEKQVFQHISFIKKQPRDQWPSFISDHLGVDAVYKYVSDYTAYESLFEPFLLALELAVYKYIVAVNFPELYEWIAKIAGQNNCSFKHVVVSITGKRMSGDMCTSLGNGWATHIVVSHIVRSLYGVEPIVLQEGDDTIFLSPGPVDVVQFEQFGLEVKLDRVSRINVAQFCQLLFDDETMRIVRDPIKYLVGFGWGGPDICNSKKKHESLLQCKALSALSQYPGHPIIQSMATWIMRCTSQSNLGKLELFIERERTFDNYMRKIYLDSVKDTDWQKFVLPVSHSSRVLVEELFEVPTGSQLQLESWFESQTELCPVPQALIESWVQPEWLMYDEWYVRPRQCNTPSVDFVQVGPTF